MLDVDTGADRIVAESATLLFEAPNWTPDGRSLLVNGDGGLFRIPPTGGDLEPVDLGGVPGINNDHVLSPDGGSVFVSAFDGHLYEVDLGTAAARQVSNDRGEDFYHFLHGVSPDGTTLAYIGMTVPPDGAPRTNVYTLPVNGGTDVQLTDDEFPDDGCEYSPDGEWIWFNSERGSGTPGHAQLFRMRTDGSDLEQLTFDERVNWFPHVSPDGARTAYISFPPGTQGHPADLDVILRLLGPDHSTRDLCHPLGGQGTINVASWAQDSRQLAYVDYPVER
ncbi:MAG: TolB family protein [Propionibacteriaceae bacterium]|nr:TolB family protein [Propionibacteriaceae bacterium]